MNVCEDRDLLRISYFYPVYDIISNSDRRGKGANADEHVEHGKPAAVGGDVAKPVCADCTAKVAEAVQNSRKLARAHSFFKGEGYHTCDDIVYACHKAGNKSKAGDRDGKRGVHKEHKYCDDKGEGAEEKKEAGEDKAFRFLLNSDGEHCAEDAEKWKNQGKKNGQPLGGAVNFIENIGSPGGESVLDKII